MNRTDDPLIIVLHSRNERENNSLKKEINPMSVLQEGHRAFCCCYFRKCLPWYTKGALGLNDIRYKMLILCSATYGEALAAFKKRG